MLFYLLHHDIVPNNAEKKLYSFGGRILLGRPSSRVLFTSIFFTDEEVSFEDRIAQFFPFSAPLSHIIVFRHQK